MNRIGGLLPPDESNPEDFTPDDLLRALGNQHDMPAMDISNLDVPPDVLEMVSPEMARMYEVVPIAFKQDCLTLAMADPRNVNALDDLRFILDCRVEGVVATKEQIQKAIERWYGAL